MGENYEIYCPPFRKSNRTSCNRIFCRSCNRRKADWENNHFAKNHRAKSVPYLSFDDPAEELSAKNDAKTFIEFHQPPFMFDEIQYVQKLFRYLKIEIDENRTNGMCYLTRSQQFRLMESATESLSDRIGTVQLYPFSERELLGDSFTEPFIPTKEYL